MVVLAPLPVTRGDLRVLVGKDDVVLGALAIDQRELHDLTFGGGQHRVDLSVDRAADADEDHAALGNAGAQGVVGVRHIGDAGSGRRLRCLIGLRLRRRLAGRRGRLAGRCRCAAAAPPLLLARRRPTRRGTR